MIYTGTAEKGICSAFKAYSHPRDSKELWRDVEVQSDVVDAQVYIFLKKLENCSSVGLRKNIYIH